MQEVGGADPPEPAVEVAIAQPARGAPARKAHDGAGDQREREDRGPLGDGLMRNPVPQGEDEDRAQDGTAEKRGNEHRVVSPQLRPADRHHGFRERG